MTRRSPKPPETLQLALMRLALRRALIELEYADARLGLDRQYTRRATLEAIRVALKEDKS